MRRLIVRLTAGLLVGASMGLTGMALPSMDARATLVSQASTRPVAGARKAGLIPSPARPVGYSAHVEGQPDPARYAGLIQAGGATSLRDDVFWASVEPSRGRFDWAGPDETVAQAARRHLHALLIVDTSPRWASGGSTSNPIWFWLPPRRPAAYGAFAGRVAARYGPGGTFWRQHPHLPRYLPAGLELWNEENISSFWGGRTPSPRRYAAMVKAAYRAIKRADRGMTVVTGGLAYAGAYNDVTCSYKKGSTGHDATAWNGVNYLQALYADGARGYFNAVGWHPYNFWNHATAAQMLRYNRCSTWTQLDSTPTSVRSVMTAHGNADLRVWITETGAPTCVRGVAYTCVTPAQQARLATREARAWKRLSWAGGFYWYDIRDDHGASPAVQAHFGAVTWPDSPKPAYYALRRAWR